MAKEYSTWEGKVTYKDYNLKEKHWILVDDKSKNTIKARRGNAKQAKFNKACTFEVSLGKEKNVGDIWYINEFKNITPELTPKPQEKNSSSGGYKGGYDSAGQERGNYRNNLTNFIIAKIPLAANIAPEEAIHYFNSLLKFGEKHMLGTPESKQLDTPPAEGTGEMPEGPKTTTDSEVPF